MGHIRLGTLPRTRQWIQVLDLIGSGGRAHEVAAATIAASRRGLISRAKDPGLLYTVWLLTQVPLAARSEDFVARLRELGLAVSDSPSLLEVVGAFTGAVDDHLRRTGGRTDLGEMAQMAASEALAAVGAPDNAFLFVAPGFHAQQTFKAFSIPGFRTLAKEFFSRLIRKYLTYFLSRELSNHVGGDSRFSNIDQHAEFNQELDRHCRRRACTIDDLPGGWFLKTDIEGGVNQVEVAEFVQVALKDLVRYSPVEPDGE
jgi:hypothetical protein